MNMTILEMFADSTHLQALQDSITADMELQQVLLETQGTVNAFIASLGANLRSDIIADTFMMFGDVFNSENIKYFSVGAVFHNKATNKQTSTVFPFVFLLVDAAGAKAGLYYNGDAS